MKRLHAFLDGMNDLEKVLWGGLLLLAAGLAFSPAPWLAAVAPGGILIFIALRADPAALAELADLEDGKE